MTNHPLPYDLIVFDWDGTLRDSIATIVGCASAALQDLGLAFDQEAIRRSIGLGLAESVPRWSPGVTAHQVEQVVERYRQRWIADWNDRSTCFDGVPELLQSLGNTGYLLAVATGKGRRGLDVDLEHSQLGSHFATTRTADECAAKPAPQMLFEILDELGIRADRTLVVGDTTHDLQMARNGGADAVATLQGAMPRERLEPLALDCLESVVELTRWLESQPPRPA